ncbi:MBL fold metallo-hydrolase [Pelagibacterium limicola]|uniref:MBL fold metallo-hydrolase n=1 Tax=Pelagibacterium limicola TaxID=2791022 RepID=UPI0018AFD6FB|nr:MBL fold metallo-hydrolase [Pelagibacterium limicola]
MTVSLSFFGAAGTVTGSCYRITHPKGSFLVDCGMFQGNKSVRDLNYKPFPFAPGDIDYVLLTHAHIDHCGLLPRLYRKGARARVYATAATNRLLEFVLADAAGIQESEAERETKKRKRRGEAPAEPLYELKDAEETLRHLTDIAYDEWFVPGPGVRARFWNAGHILGSASIEIEIEDGNGSPVRILFSGDIGPDEKAFYPSPEAPAGLDYLVCEATYGGRERAAYTLDNRRAALAAEIAGAMERGGNLIIPTFAVERSQELLHDIGVLIKQGTINPSLVALDSPLASRVTGLFGKFAAGFEDVELSAEELFADPRFRIIEDVEESKGLNAIHGGAIILSASGMAEAGRIKHHLRNNLFRHNATVLFVGYQAQGTLGQIIQSGAKEVRIHGTLVPVRATIRTIQNYSAHADHSELLAWIKARQPVSGAAFLVHGDDEPRAALRAALLALGMASDQVIVPELDDMVTLMAGGQTALAHPAAPRISHAQLSHDWHNAYAEFVIALSDRLRGASSDEDRARIMETLKQTLERR